MTYMELIALGNFVINSIYVLIKIKKERKKQMNSTKAEHMPPSDT